MTSKNLFSTFAALLLFCSVVAQTKTVPQPQNLQNPLPQKAITGKQLQSSAPQTDEKKEAIIKLENERFHYHIEKLKLTNSDFKNSINNLIGLNDSFSFKVGNSNTDELNITHHRYYQLYKGIPIDGRMILAHEKNGNIYYANGHIAMFDKINVTPAITEQEAKAEALKILNASELIQEFPIELLIAKRLDNNEYRLAYKVRIDATKPNLMMKEVYIDALTKDVINVSELIHHADVQGTAQTLYSGTQTITTDNFAPNLYRLRESGRKIETYDATNTSGFSQGDFITGTSDYVSPSTTWQVATYLNSFTISSVATSWWYTTFADEQPDLYIKVKNGSNQTVYTSGYINNTFPSVTFNNPNIYLTNPPYTVEIWDYDVVGGDDFGGSYTINTSTGTINWSGNGNNGSYSILAKGHPALDVHWGMEKTYDFFLSVFSRNSYDGNGSVIQNYLNPPLTSQQVAQWPNNAFALNPPYNKMVYGMGDGANNSPLVGLDVEGHEFTHMVINYNGNGGLVYQGESGALNESFADIFGTCIEFYSGVNPDWLIGEDFSISAPFMRSMSNPKLANQPDTYNSGSQNYWYPPNCGVPGDSNDYCGVHINSGVQNKWFYLLSVGGSGVNDKGDSYTVNGITIQKAQRIAYRNLTTYLTPNATYWDAYQGSLQATADLYGAASPEYFSVRQAWYAVGIGTAPVPNAACSGTTTLTAPSGTVTDGSGTANYSDNLNCKWIIAPPGANQITINFTAFNLEVGYDTVFIYPGTDTTGTPLTYTGTSLPASIQTPAGLGAVLVKFKTDVSQNATGWSFNYSTSGTPTCTGFTSLKTPAGSFTDGSGAINYGNNQDCFWYIAPPCASTVTLTFSQFATEQNFDGVIIYDDLFGTNQLAVFTGNSLPASVTSTTGTMLVRFVSDYTTTLQGFTANYTSTGAAYCSGTTTLNTADFGTITDGSGISNYCNNMECQWLIQPPQGTSITISFTEFDLENASPDGQSVYDAVEVYAGASTNAPLLGRFTGSNIPPSVTSNIGTMLVRFYSDLFEVKQGFKANYTSTTTTYCSGTTTLTAPSGSFTDGSGTLQYGNNSQCSWLIQPPNATSITLSFTAFATELNNDGVLIYDGSDNTAPLLGQFSGNNIPSSLTSTGGSMYVEFLSNPSVRGNGWSANYTSVIPPPIACSGTTTLTAQSATFSDGSGANHYGSNSGCSWLIQPANAGKITLSFSAFDTEINKDFVSIYDGVNTSAPLLGQFSGNSIPASITSTGGAMFVHFTSDSAVTAQGWSASYSSCALPAVTLSPQNVSVCEGASVNFTASTSSGVTDIEWFRANQSLQSGSSFYYSIPLTQFSDSGTFHVIATSSCGQKQSNNTNLKVYPNPPAHIQASATTICSGKPLVLTALQGSNITWQPGSFISQTITVYPSQNTKYFLQSSASYPNVTCLGRDSVTIDVVPNPIPNLGSDTSFCVGGSITLNAGNFNTYQWSNNGTTKENEIFTIGNYVVTVTDNNNCTGTDNINVSTYPQPQINLGNDTAICAGQFVVLDANGAFSNVQWSHAPSGSASVVTQTGSYTVTVTDFNNCTATDNINVAVDVCSSIQSMEENTEIKLYPNPTFETVTFEFSDEILRKGKIQIFSSNGNLVLTHFYQIKNSHFFNLNISEISTGIYTVVISDNKQIAVKKLVVY